MNKMTYTIDAKDKAIGRVAAEAAKFLMGKNATSFKRNVAPDVTVNIINASQAKVSEKKSETKTYSRYSGYPGGLKKETLGEISARRGFGEVLKHAIKGMLPKNKLRAKMLKNLFITE